MTVRVDAWKCQGHHAGITVAGELFDVDELGYANEKNDGVVPPELEEKARRAVDNCPEVAITIED